MPTKYTVIIIGLNPNGDGGTQARANLARLLKAPAEKIDKLLDSLPTTVKKNVERELGEKYVKLLSQAGVSAELKPEELELSLEPRVEKAPEEVPQFTCPQCGVVVEKPGQCSACLTNIAPVNKPSPSVDKIAKRRERNEQIRQSAFGFLINWVRGSVWKAGIVFVLMLFFGSSFLVSAVFHTKDKHLVYQTLSSRTVCIKDPTNILAMHSNTDRDLFAIFYREFNEDEKEQLVEKWNNVACRAIYEMELGNIGDDPVSANIEFATWRFVRGSRVSNIVIPKYRNLSGSNAREQNPVSRQEDGVLTLENIYPGTLVNLRFGGWVEGEDAAVEWEEMLTDISVDEGVVEIGDPLTTTFGRLLTVFF